MVTETKVKLVSCPDSDQCRCNHCGVEGVYGTDIIDTDWYDPITNHDTVKVMCRDINACFDRKTHCRLSGKIRRCEV